MAPKDSVFIKTAIKISDSLGVCRHLVDFVIHAPVIEFSSQKLAELAPYLAVWELTRYISSYGREISCASLVNELLLLGYDILKLDDLGFLLCEIFLELLLLCFCVSHVGLGIVKILRELINLLHVHRNALFLMPNLGLKVLKLG